MKIAVIHNLSPGGQKRCLQQQIKILSKKYIVDLFTLSSTDDSFCPIKPYVRKHFTVQLSKPVGFWNYLKTVYDLLPRAYQNLAELINRGNYDVAFVGSCWLTQSPYILRYLKNPSVYFCHEPKREFYESIPRSYHPARYWISYPFRYPIKMIDRLNTRSATRVLVNSSYSKSVIDRVYGVNSTVNYLGVDTKVFKSIGDKKQKYVLSVGNLSLLKGHDFIIRSLNRIPENIRPKLIIIGNGGVEKDELIRLANKLNVTMEIHEKLNDQDLVSYYNRASAFLFAAMGEPFGLVLLEAAASGIPIIAVGEGGVREILTKMPNTVLVKRDEKVFAEKLISYLNHPKNDISKLQIAYVKKYWSWEKSVGQLDRVLTETLV